MNAKKLIAVSLVTLATAQAAIAQEATPDHWTRATASQTREQVKAELAAARAAGELNVASEYGIFERPFVSTLTRAEVIADLQVWNESGLGEFYRGEAGPEVHTQRYQRAAEKYAQLRSSPNFALLVEQIAGKSQKVALAR